MLDKVHMQFQTFMEDPMYKDQHGLYVELIKTFARIGPNAEPKFRDECKSMFDLLLRLEQLYNWFQIAWDIQVELAFRTVQSYVLIGLVVMVAVLWFRVGVELTNNNYWVWKW